MLSKRCLPPERLHFRRQTHITVPSLYAHLTTPAHASHPRTPTHTHLRRRLIGEGIIFRLVRHTILRRAGTTRIRRILLLYPLQAISSRVVLPTDIRGAACVRQVGIEASLGEVFAFGLEGVLLAHHRRWMCGITRCGCGVAGAVELFAVCLVDDLEDLRGRKLVSVWLAGALLSRSGKE